MRATRFGLVSCVRVIAMVTFIPGSLAAAECEANQKNGFSGAALNPGGKAVAASVRLSRATDYGDHPVGWLTKRLFPLDDDVEITGELVTQPECFVQSSDDDLTLFVKLSDESYEDLTAYFTPPAATPRFIHIEMVGALSEFNGASPFKTWRASCGNDRVQFALDAGEFHPIQASGDELHAVDWVALKSGERKSISVRGTLVVDTSGFRAGSGELEIHPAEYLRLSKTPLSP